MQTVKDLVEITIAQSLKHLTKRNGYKELENDPFVLESIMTKVLNHPEISKIRYKILPLPKEDNRDKKLKPSEKKPIVLGTHSVIDVQICQLASVLSRINYNKLFIPCREREVVDARKQIANIMHKYVGYTTKKIGSIFGKDHSTVIHWLASHFNLIETSNSYLNLYETYLDHLKEQMPNIVAINTTKVQLPTQFKAMEEEIRIKVKKRNKERK